MQPTPLATNSPELIAVLQSIANAIIGDSRDPVSAEYYFSGGSSGALAYWTSFTFDVAPV